MKSFYLTSSFLLLSAAQIPSVASDAGSWKPANGPLITRWAANVKPDKVHPDYPRPQLTRTEWVNLNGLWDFAIRPKAEDKPASFDGQILVPFPVESALSGVMKPVKPEEKVWYHRTVELPPSKQGQRWLIHFGAVDWETTVFVNGKKVGEHRGGFDPFTFDVTPALKKEGKQEIAVAVWDPTDQGNQPRGKQVLKPGGIMYTANTGIWQTVWLEPVPEARIDRLKIIPDVDNGEVKVTAVVEGGNGGETIRVTALDNGKEVGTAEGKTNAPIAIKLNDPKLWAPGNPFLYGLTVAIQGGEQVGSYFGMRKISVEKDQAGVNRLFLNGKPLFQYGPLDQGWWPDGLYTAPTDEALKYDLDITQKLGFNMIRKHVKVEPSRWYYYCDTMGLLVWQDMPSGDNRDDASKQQFAAELKAMIDALHNHPSIVMWVPFNEGWGQHDTPKVVAWNKSYDPTRLVNNASGWTDSGTGDVSDMHNYPGPGMPKLEDNRAAVLGEFGGLGLPLDNHLWVNKDNWGYRSYKTKEELTSAYLDLVARLHRLVSMGLSAAVYTQTTDCEIEVNGLLTYDRAVIKVPVEEVAGAHATLYKPTSTVKVLLPSAETEPQTWSYTTSSPGDNWTAENFDDSSWSTGKGGFGTAQTPNTKFHTEWKTSDIWLRKTIDLPAGKIGDPHLYLFHDEDAEIYVNGKLVTKVEGHQGGYGLQPIDKEASQAFRPGKNVLAVHCHQTQGGQYIDLGLVGFSD